MADLRTDEDMENFCAWFWLIAWWGAREVLPCSWDKRALAAVLSVPLRLESVSKNLFPSTLIGGSCIKAISGQALFCLVTITSLEKQNQNITA